MNKPQLFYQNAAELLDSTIAIYKKTFTQQMTVTAIMYAVGGLATALLMILLLLVGVVGFMNSFITQTMSGGAVVFLVVCGIMVYTLMTVLSAATYAANMSLAQQSFNNEKPNVSKAFSVTLKALFRLFTTMFAAMLAYLPVFLLFGGLCYVFFQTLETAFLNFSVNDYSTGIFVFVMILFALLVFVFLLLLIESCFCLAIPVSLFENKRFFGALKRSFELVKQDYFKIMGMLVVNFLVIYGISYSFRGVFAVFTTLLPILGDMLSTNTQILLMASTYIDMIISMGVSLLIAPISAIFVSSLYLNQKVKLEGLDIEMAIDNLPQPEKGAPHDIS